MELEETVKEILTGQIEEQLEVSRKREYYNLATMYCGWIVGKQLLGNTDIKKLKKENR